ncbi:MAG: hypothetical protein NWE83_05520 [Candidatus Bathyarchaeota archaeon]|nr:hypothetical protein [Candidatus Bathyarchaeota archaeon]
MIHRVTIILAEYCPHCVPFSLSNAKKIAHDLNVPLRVLNIENSAQELLADKLVKEHGDWSEDYLIPQVFVEYADGRVIHLLTGFSEAVSATESAWQALFSSSFYKNLVHEQAETHRNTLKDIVENDLTFSNQCRRHCTKSTSFIELWSNPTKMVKAYVCPGGYVSRVIAFSMHPAVTWFRNFIVNQGVGEILNDRDLRLASRHGWELETDISHTFKHISPTGIIYEVYWTTYPKTDEERRRGLFLCSDDEQSIGCKRLFVQNINSPRERCPQCNMSDI